MPKAPENLKDFASLVKVVEFLRGPDGCPWDKEQTHQSLTRFAIEEAHEFADAVDNGNPHDVCDELGDMLLQVVLNAQVAKENHQFSIEDIIEAINKKMVRRHPHVFADVKVKDSQEVLKKWAEIKSNEQSLNKNQNRIKEKSPFGVPTGMASLLRASLIGEKTRKVDFDFANHDQALAKVDEELSELKEALHGDAFNDKNSRAQIEAELGDLLFSVAQLARLLNFDPEQVLRKSNSAFESRYSRMRNLVESDGLDWSNLSPEKKEQYWKRAKLV